MSGNIIGTVWNKDSVDPCTLDHNPIWTSLCSCDDITCAIGCTCVASVVYGSGVSGIVDGASVARVSSCVVGCTGVTSIVDGASITSCVGVSGGIVSGV